MSLPIHATALERVSYYGLRLFSALVLFFLIIPILVIIPLSFNAEPFFTFTEGMLRLEPEAYSLRWYRNIWESQEWMLSIKNSMIIGVCATLLAMTLGTLAALGLSQRHMPFKGAIMGLLISPMIVPVIISAASMYFFFTKVNLAQTYLGVIMAHAVLGIPFVIITVTATLVGFDDNLTKASASLGANPRTTFFKVTFPLIRPGVISGALFAFATSFDEVVVVLFVAGTDQRTIPREMWAGMREQLSPTILAVATLLIVLSVMLLLTVELLRRRSDRIRGVTE
ncbi:ABC transporter permease [Aestuariirhabdus litorea]|uniref:ABC transporter permease n=1 Tax=Aestuariirhabdus litorea TaxID=2528527 RepID=A0A3P3VK29_9GAMM|nr:ABC transporter permease [Aestuariirhabdus litorea]RRJ83085.1 ABC transporter permease [Aestuariirhabdus litorea]RWW93242.1 ABC transporter permease subunit [Endozoicomonadaceae bacterium GTF-13]